MKKISEKAIIKIALSITRGLNIFLLLLFNYFYKPFINLYKEISIPYPYMYGTLDIAYRCLFRFSYIKISILGLNFKWEGLWSESVYFLAEKKRLDLLSSGVYLSKGHDL